MASWPPKFQTAEPNLNENQISKWIVNVERIRKINKFRYMMDMEMEHCECEKYPREELRFVPEL